MLSEGSARDSLMDNQVDGDGVPTVFISPEQLLLVRGRSCWGVIFVFYQVFTSCLFGGLAYAVTGSVLEACVIAVFILICCNLVVFVRRCLRDPNDTKHLSFAHTCQYFLRGAVMAVFIASILELTELRDTPKRPVTLGDLPVAVLVGFAEETAKLIVLLLGLCVTPLNLPQSLVAPSRSTFFLCCPFAGCVRFSTILVESPRALALAGMAVGYGFMASENLWYYLLMSVFMKSVSLAFLGVMVMRSVFNLHPILTGLTATRLASLVWTSPVQPDNSLLPTRSTPDITKSISIGRIVYALYPSVILHALYDFGWMFTFSHLDQFDTDCIVIVVSLLAIPVAFTLLIIEFKRLPKFV